MRGEVWFRGNCACTTIYKQLENRSKMSKFGAEIAKGERFEFGKNWNRFLSSLDNERILESEKHLLQMLECENLVGKSFLDVGSGSGLFSLAARRLGMQVHSLDYDPQSVACTSELKRRYFRDDSNWTIEEGSVLDADYMKSLGEFDIVYAWGVLHHTGAMRQSLENVQIPVAPEGLLFISIYNYQVYWTALNVQMKRAYVHSPLLAKWVIAGSFIAFQVIKGLSKDLVLLRNPAQRYHDKKKSRGMSTWHDWIDWVGGYPFEVAKPEEIFDFFRSKEFSLVKLKTCGGGHGCNQFVFIKSHEVM